MNIFFLSRDHSECARMHVDKHVVKMIVETAQLLSTAHHVLDGEQAIPSIYKVTHKNHPSAIWVRESKAHYQWLWKLLDELCKEYTYRYQKVHKVEREGLLSTLKVPPVNLIEDKWISDPPPAMPDECKQKDDAIESYRNYYAMKKYSFAKWKNRDTPKWFSERILTMLTQESQLLGLYD